MLVFSFPFLEDSLVKAGVYFLTDHQKKNPRNSLFKRNQKNSAHKLSQIYGNLSADNPTKVLRGRNPTPAATAQIPRSFRNQLRTEVITIMIRAIIV